MLKSKNIIISHIIFPKCVIVLAINYTIINTYTQLYINASNFIWVTCFYVKLKPYPREKNNL